MSQHGIPFTSKRAAWRHKRSAMSEGALPVGRGRHPPNRVIPGLSELQDRWIYLNPTALPRYRAAGCTVRVESETRNRVELATDCSTPSMLETSEAYYTAWRATVDGSETPIQIVHLAFRGLQLPAGQHTVRFEYALGLLRICGPASMLFWLVWALVVWRSRHRASGG